jgi:hypothetical protein
VLEKFFATEHEVVKHLLIGPACAASGIALERNKWRTAELVDGVRGNIPAVDTLFA